MRDMTGSYVWHDSCICLTWLIYIWRVPIHMICDSNQLDWHIHTCCMTQFYAWHDDFICGTCRIHMCDMMTSYVWHASFMYQGHPFTWFGIVISWIDIFICGTDSFLCVTWYSYVWHVAFIRVTCLIHMCGMTHSYVWPVTWLIHVSRVPVHMICDSDQLDSHTHTCYGLISMCDVTYS